MHVTNDADLIVSSAGNFDVKLILESCEILSRSFVNPRRSRYSSPVLYSTSIFCAIHIFHCRSEWFSADRGRFDII